mmetsp:Transcript_118182/g.164634  ORF Transcript_118182/g.164634 Transcript_118182/m.164634 type:complete len:153 (-) Transcript_118182:71-529(-)
MKEKQEFLKAKREMEARLEQDKIERFGLEKYKQMKAEEEAKKKSPIQIVESGIKKVETLYTEQRQPGVAKTCFKTCATFAGNVLKDPSNEKFRKVNLENNAVQNRVAKINGGLQILTGMGFVQKSDGNYLFMDDVDLDLVTKSVEMLKKRYE